MKTYTAYEMPKPLIENENLWKEMCRGNVGTTYAFSLAELFETDILCALFHPSLVIFFDELSVTITVRLSVNQVLGSATLMVPSSVDGAKVLVDLAYREVIATAKENLGSVIDSLQKLHAAISETVKAHE